MTGGTKHSPCQSLVCFYDGEGGGLSNIYLHTGYSKPDIGTVTAAGFLVGKQNIFCETLGKKGRKGFRTRLMTFRPSKP